MNWIEGAPTWVNAVIAAAALLTAVGVIWRKAVQPIVKGTSDVVDEVRSIRSLLETDENGFGLNDRVKVVETRSVINFEAIERLTGTLDDLVVTVHRIDRRTLTLEPNGGSSGAPKSGTLADKVERINVNTPDKETP